MLRWWASGCSQLAGRRFTLPPSEPGRDHRSQRPSEGKGPLYRGAAAQPSAGGESGPGC
jgi:hypothetical protein